MANINAVKNVLSGVTGTGAFVGATSPTLVTPNIGTPSAGVITNCTGSPVLTGVTNGSSAAAGKVGEVISSAVSISPGISLTNATSANITSISLTDGDWDIYGQIYFLPDATTTVVDIGASVSLTSATVASPSSLTESYAQIEATLTTGVGQCLALSVASNSISSTTTYYLVARAQFAVSTMVAGGKIIARRRR